MESGGQIKMVFHSPKCLCGGTLLPTENAFGTDEGTGRYYKCNKCGGTMGMIEAIYC